MLWNFRILIVTELLSVICLNNSNNNLELSRWDWQQEEKWLVMVGKSQEGLDLKYKRILIKSGTEGSEMENLMHVPSEKGNLKTVRLTSCNA